MLLITNLELLYCAECRAWNFVLKIQVRMHQQLVMICVELLGLLLSLVGFISCISNCCECFNTNRCWDGTRINVVLEELFDSILTTLTLVFSVAAIESSGTLQIPLQSRTKSYGRSGISPSRTLPDSCSMFTWLWPRSWHGTLSIPLSLKLTPDFELPYLALGQQP